VPRKHRRTHTHNGETIDRTFTSKKLADEWKSQMVRHSERVKAGLPIVMEDVRFKVAAARYILVRKETMDYWRQDEAKFRRGFLKFLGEKYVREITKTDCDLALHGIKRDLGLSEPTFNRYRACLSGFFKYLIEEGYRETNPVMMIPMKEESRRGEHVTDEQAEAYLREARKEKALWFFPLIALAMNTGLRTGELLALRVKDFNPKRKFIEIKIRYQVTLKKERPGTKGGKGRAVPLNEFVARVFAEYLSKTQFNSPGDFLFHSNTGERANPHTLNDIHRRVADAAGVPKEIRLYDITRHKYASAVVQATGNMRLAQMILGHVSTKTTERYVHDDPAYLLNQASMVVVGDGNLAEPDLGKDWEKTLQ
jgi:integrase/recombinase XerD